MKISEIRAELKERFPIGKRVRLIQANSIDLQELLPPPPNGSLGIVWGVDEDATIRVKWDNGSDYNVIYGKDIITSIIEPDEKFDNWIIKKVQESNN